jgi:hypothetical protein
MAKADQCHHCQRFSSSLDPEHLVCGIHPSGPEQSPCLDFAEAIGQWEPLGAGYYDGELILQPEHYLSTEERLEILDTHPLFTGVYPKCSAPVGQDLVHYDCSECDFKDDLIN